MTTSLSQKMILMCVRNPVFANLAAISLLVGGIVAMRNLPRESFPETAVGYIQTSVTYPGANPDDVERGACIKIEQAIKGVRGVGEVVSFARHDMGQVFAEYDPDVTPTIEVMRLIQDRVNGITTFPEETERPVVTESIIRNPVIYLGVYGQAPERTIKQVAEDIRNELLAHRGMSQVSLSGVREFEISIELTEETLKRYGITLQQVMERISQSSLDLPAGTLRTRREEIDVRTLGQRYTAADFEELVIIARPDGTSVRLGQIAQVRDAFEEAPIIGRINGEPGAVLTIAKTGKEDISRIAGMVRDYVAAASPHLPEGIHLATWGDASREVDARLEMLVKNCLMGMALVVVCLLFFLDLPSSLAVSLGIPVSFAGALAALNFTGNSLNMISLLGLLMTVGIIVDDAIVIAESVWAERRSGLVPQLAAMHGTHRVALPVLASTATSIVAFVPLMNVEGVMGKLIFTLPVVVIAALLASTIEAFVILPAHLAEWLPNPSVANADSRSARLRRRLDRGIDAFIERAYRPALRRTLHGRLVVFGVALGAVLICTGLVVGGRTPFVLWPKFDTNQVRARVRFPEGTPIEVTHAAVARIEAAAMELNDEPVLRPAAHGDLVQQSYSVVGEWTARLPERGSALGEVSLELMPAELRRVEVAQVTDVWRRSIGTIPDAESVTISEEQLGPTDKPLEIRLLGQNLDELRQASEELAEKLGKYAGVFNITIEPTYGKRELRVSLKPAAANLGLTVADLATQLRQGLYGGEAVRLQRGSDEIKVMVSYVESDRQSLSAIENLRIRTRGGAAIPFHEVAETAMVRGYSLIPRMDGQRRARVQADVDERYANAERIVQDLEAAYLPDLERRFPGVHYVIDGQRKRINESLNSLVHASVIAGVVMFALLGTVLRSYIQPVIIMTAIPLGMVGAVVGHAVMGYPLTLMSAFGMVGLAGVVVNDAIVLIDRINLGLATGRTVRDAVADAGQARFRAVLLTSVTTVAGLLPLLAERSTQALTLIPLAISIAFGLIFATGTTLFVVPTLFLLLNDIKRVIFWLVRGGSYPVPESVEPACVSAAELPTTSRSASGAI